MRDRIQGDTLFGDFDGHGNKPMTVGELTRKLKKSLEREFQDVCVSGEISNYKLAASGHAYFSIKDEYALIQAVMFGGRFSRLDFVPENGMKVVVSGSISVYEQRGQYQIIVSDMRQDGVGNLHAKFEALKKKLAEEGLFDSERKKKLPVFPETVGLVTSVKGAVIRDFVEVLKKRAPGIRILVRGVRVQGDGACREIVSAINAFNQQGGIDVIVLARGGGSIEDLWAFNEEIVARAIAGSKIPTISAIGHQTDFTIADFVADKRSPTPSAAAEEISREWSAWREDVRLMRSRLLRATKHFVDIRKEGLERVKGHYFKEPARAVRQYQQRVDDLREALRSGLVSVTKAKRQALDYVMSAFRSAHPAGKIKENQKLLSMMSARLGALSHETTLRRGYAIITDDSGTILRQVKAELVGKTIRARLAGGNITATVSAFSKPE